MIVEPLFFLTGHPEFTRNVQFPSSSKRIKQNYMLCEAMGAFLDRRAKDWQFLKKKLFFNMGWVGKGKGIPSRGGSATSENNYIFSVARRYRRSPVGPRYPEGDPFENNASVGSLSWVSICSSAACFPGSGRNEELGKMEEPGLNFCRARFAIVLWTFCDFFQLFCPWQLTNT